MKDVKKDFASFTDEPSEEPGSSYLLAKIQKQIQSEAPSVWTLAGKLTVAHAIGTVLTLMSCEQFGLQLFFTGGGLMHYFMLISPDFCMACCGALYLMISFFVARQILNWDEWLLLLQKRTLSISVLSLMTLTVFGIFSGDVTFESGLLWLFGAALGAEFIIWIRSPFWKLRSLFPFLNK